MLDSKLLRTDFERVVAALKRKGFEFDLEMYRTTEKRRKTLQVEVEELRSKSKFSAKAIGEAKAKGNDVQGLLHEADKIKKQVASLEDELTKVKAALDETLWGVPNMPDDDVPDGQDENDNIERRRWGEQPNFSFEVKDHVAIAEGLQLMDNEMATKIVGSRFTVLFGDLAKLQRALLHFMLDLHINQHGYREVYVPYIVNADSMRGTGQLPKFKEELFVISDDRYLIPTAEVPLTNLCRNKILEEKELPLKFVSHTPCFRSEAGSYGKDTHGLIRQHQFEKVEMVQVVRAQDSSNALEELTGHAEAVLQALELPYRMVELCTGDLGFSSAKTYDLEVWLPGQQRYREISSCSNMTDFQARRIKARVRTGKGKPELIHTLNGSGLAVGRTLVAILENFQNEQGGVRIPATLVPYMDGQEMICLKDT